MSETTRPRHALQAELPVVEHVDAPVVEPVETQLPVVEPVDAPVVEPVETTTMTTPPVQPVETQRPVVESVETTTMTTTRNANRRKSSGTRRTALAVLALAALGFGVGSSLARWADSAAGNDILASTGHLDLEAIDGNQWAYFDSAGHIVPVLDEFHSGAKDVLAFPGDHVALIQQVKVNTHGQNIAAKVSGDCGTDCQTALGTSSLFSYIGESDPFESYHAAYRGNADWRDLDLADLQPGSPGTLPAGSNWVIAPEYEETDTYYDVGLVTEATDEIYTFIWVMPLRSTATLDELEDLEMHFTFDWSLEQVRS